MVKDREIDMDRPGKKGFSFILLVIVIAVIVGVAGVVIPVVTEEASLSQIDQAKEDMHRLAAAINRYVKDTLFYPTGVQGATTYHFLYTEGILPVNNLLASGPGMPIGEILNTGAFGGSRWSGPYLEEIPVDPWGNAYIVNVQGFFYKGEVTAIYSAGPNSRIDTPITSSAPALDDILLLLD